MPATRMRSAVIAALLAVVVAGCGLLDPEEPAQDQILFVRSGTNDGDVYRMNADGSGLVNLTESPDRYTSLDITPDGRTVIFGRQNDCQIWTMGPDGSNQKPISDSCGAAPHLSPDGRLVVYVSDNAIHVMGIDGTGSREVSMDLPPVVPSPCGEIPRWHVWPFGWVSPNRVAFRRHICGVGTTFYAVDADGSDLAEIDFNPQSAHLSPDATRIAFDRIGDVHEERAVTVMSADGSQRRTVADDGWLPDRFNISRSPWSPSGGQLYYWRNDGHHVVDLSSTESRPLVEPPPTSSGFLGWSPRGDRMLFVVIERDDTGASASSDIYVVKADGTGMVNLTRSASFNTDAVWVPRR